MFTLSLAQSVFLLTSSERYPSGRLLADDLEEKLAELRKSLPVDIVPHEIDLDYRYYSVGEWIPRDGL